MQRGIRSVPEFRPCRPDNSQNPHCLIFQLLRDDTRDGIKYFHFFIPKPLFELNVQSKISIETFEIQISDSFGNIPINKMA